MKILICDDDVQSIHVLEIHVHHYMNSHFIPVKIHTSSDSQSIMGNKEIYDIAFLDIQMDLVDGISLGTELRRRNSRLVLFFVTNYNEYIDNAMDLNAFRYFSKPFDAVRLYSGLDKAMEYFEESYVYVYAKSDSKYCRIEVDDILYVAKEGRHIIIQAISGLYYTQETFDEFCGRLPQSFYFLVHKSFFVNLHHICEYSYKELRMTDGTRISVAPRKQSAFHKFWFEYLRRH